ncbi:hypothetical protein JW752_01890 [Candidatus Peregrinibacteria bacterium]|nr:hypothetical protein [Candidatus Peregrinibacteria bacterium]
MANPPRNNNDPNAPGFQAPDRFPTMEEVGEEARAQGEAPVQAGRQDPEKAEREAKKILISRRRFLIGSLILGLAAVASYEIDKQRQSEIKEEVDKLIEQIDLDELMTIHNAKESEAVKQLAEALDKKGYKKDSATGNYLSPELVKTAGDKLVDEDLEELPEECGRYKYDKYEMNIDELYKLKEPAAKAFIQADKKMVADGKGHIKISRAFSVNMQQNDLFIAKQENPKLPPTAPPGHSLHEVGLAVDVANWPEAKPYLIAEGFFWLGGWRWSEKHHFQWGVTVEESLAMEGLYQVHRLKKKGKKWLDKGSKWLKKKWNNR